MLNGIANGFCGEQQRFVLAQLIKLFAELLRDNGIGVQREMWTVLFMRAERQNHDDLALWVFHSNVLPWICCRDQVGKRCDVKTNDVSG